MSTAIKIENLSKKYIIRHQNKSAQYETFSDSLIQGSKNIISRIRHPFRHSKNTQQTQEEFWALKEINFEIEQGDRLGIIGRNGAGKSTLLKILARITEPSTGKIHINGRIASLLEVGTGFHPELTGRENIFLNGAILGMSRAEIRAKFDEIVDFAEVEKFLDTPVKRYSSGMYVRLAFAVAAHLEPEILIVDEVLAVGDAQFQKKCLGRMEYVAEKEGRTVLFVSHNMGAIKSLCTKGLYLKQGQSYGCDDINKIINEYLDVNQKSSLTYIANQPKETPYIKRVNIFQSNDKVTDIFDIDKPIVIHIGIEDYNKNDLVVSIVIRNNQGIWVHHSSDEFRCKKNQQILLGNENNIRECTIPAYGLAAGKYNVDLWLDQRNYESFDSITEVLAFEVEFTGAASDMTIGNDWKGTCGPGMLSWQ